MPCQILSCVPPRGGVRGGQFYPPPAEARPYITEKKELPRDKFELYDRLVERILYRFGKDNVKVYRAHHDLREIAHSMHTGEVPQADAAGRELPPKNIDDPDEPRPAPQARISYDHLDQLLAAVRADLDAAAREQWRDELLTHSGLLRHCDERTAEFLHLSLQEYLAAVRIKHHFDLAPDWRSVGTVFRKRARQARWRNTLAFLFAAQLANKAPPHRAVALIEEMLDEVSRQPLADVVGLHVVLAECLHILIGKFPNDLPVERQKQFTALSLRAIDEEVPVQERAALGTVLAKLGDPRLAADLRDHSAISLSGLSAYVLVPAGAYLWGDKKQPESVGPCLISRFPVTNGQFARFLGPYDGCPHGGYDDPRWWSEQGWAWVQKELLGKGRPLEPLYWRNAKWNADNQPVVGVSYHEAEAFARWAGGSLPTEKQWEAAARGQSGLVYPWGDDWPERDPQRPICNSSEAGLHVTTPVGLFPRSRSRDLGLEDMAGNVWEWCADWYDEQATGRVIRGGSWLHSARNGRSADRVGHTPDNRDNFLGFRLVAPVQAEPS